ncbi:MAG: acylphosphatase [Planctomycetes bacterium]|nr:acylphosphatase [Planctomycetota bacterium]
MRVCKRVLYWGRVQGVGFRYAAHRLAQGFAVAGFVRNLRDGQVELLAEGDPAEVGRFLETISERMADFIKGNTIQDEPPQDLSDFEIRS